MPELQVLVATMHQTDLSLWEKMNIGCDAILAYQADREEVTCRQTEQGTVKMITTTTRGVGLNRNIALLASEAEYLLFADEDVVYYDGAAREVCEAFRENPRADVLIMSVPSTPATQACGAAAPEGRAAPCMECPALRYIPDRSPAGGDPAGEHPLPPVLRGRLPLQLRGGQSVPENLL